MKSIKLKFSFRTEIKRDGHAVVPVRVRNGIVQVAREGATVRTIVRITTEEGTRSSKP